MTGLDVAIAIAKVQYAQLELEQIRALPASVGSRIRSRNGVVWQRISADEWRPTGEDLYGIGRDETWPSRHVATMDWKAVA